MAYAKLALKFAPYIAIALLIGVILWFRADLTSAKAERDAVKIEVDQLRKTNAANQRTIENFSRRQIDNDAIAAAVNAALSSNRQNADRIAIELKEARNDPVVRDWADTPVPASVRRSLTPER